MKIVCERCEKIIDTIPTNASRGWRMIKVCTLGNVLIGDEKLLCDRCYDELVDFFQPKSSKVGT